MNGKIKIIIFAVTAALLVLLLVLSKQMQNQRIPEASSGAAETTQTATIPEDFTIPDDTWEATPWG